MSVEWTQNAISDLATIFEHIATDSPRYARSVVDRITRRTSQIAAFPYSGQMVPEYQREDIRELIEYSYRILYRVEDTKVSILALVHGASVLPDTPANGG